MPPTEPVASVSPVSLANALRCISGDTLANHFARSSFTLSLGGVVDLIPLDFAASGEAAAAAAAASAAKAISSGFFVPFIFATLGSNGVGFIASLAAFPVSSSGFFCLLVSIDFSRDVGNVGVAAVVAFGDRNEILKKLWPHCIIVLPRVMSNGRAIRVDASTNIFVGEECGI